jgi:hypothetical protein
MTTAEPVEDSSTPGPVSGFDPAAEVEPAALPDAGPVTTTFRAIPADPIAAPVQTVGWLRRLMLSEPVRVYAYTLLSAVLALLVWKKVIGAEEAEQWGAFAALILGVGAAATEKVRRLVWSERSHQQVVTRAQLR